MKIQCNPQRSTPSLGIMWGVMIVRILMMISEYDMILLIFIDWIHEISPKDIACMARNASRHFRCWFDLNITFYYRNTNT